MSPLSNENPRPSFDVFPAGQVVETQAAEEILAGLSAKPRSIPSKYFYDARGSDLFERITRLDEYYPSRTEKCILTEHAEALLSDGHIESIVELGSGDCSKISILLDAAMPRHRSILYIPVDVSDAAIEKSCNDLHARFPGLRTAPMVADFGRALDKIEMSGPCIICFFGSTIGNLTREDADAFVAHVGATMRPDDRFLLGLDMVKEKSLLERAYNDAAGVTEAFNKNILLVANEIAKTNFDPTKFAHEATFDEHGQRIEMRLLAQEDMIVTAPGLPDPLLISRGETIHTEYSHKFTQAHIERFAKKGGFLVRDAYQDANGWFTLVDYVKPGPSRNHRGTARQDR